MTFFRLSFHLLTKERKKEGNKQTNKKQKRRNVVIVAIN